MKTGQGNRFGGLMTTLLSVLSFGKYRKNQTGPMTFPIVNTNRGTGLQGNFQRTTRGYSKGRDYTDPPGDKTGVHVRHFGTFSPLLWTGKAIKFRAFGKKGA